MLSRLFSAMGLAAFRGEIAATIRRLRLRLIVIGAVVAMWLLALGFAVAAFTAWLATLVGAIAACAILAGLFVVLALGLHLALRLMRRRSPSFMAGLSRAIAPLKQEDEQSGESVAEDGDDGHSASREATSTATLLVLAAVGYVMGRQLTRR
jgi:hypothetical protein